MISVQEAERIIAANPLRAKIAEVAIDKATGRILAEEIYADRDLPPYDLPTMDGIALNSRAFDSGQRIFKIQKMVSAGEPATKLADQQMCVEIMTGAILPEGADTIVRYEDIVIQDAAAAVALEKISSGQHIHFQGSDARKGDLLLTQGIKISPAEISVLASVGKRLVRVYEHPSVAIVSTGNELVAIDEVPAQHQIRSSNALALQAALYQIHYSANLFHISDDRDDMEATLATVIRSHEVILLSGGVSKGKLDFVPEVLEKLGVVKKFHQVSQRPGKPFWFGTSEKNTVFALPGNPVSTFMCFYRYIKPWLLRHSNDVNSQMAILAEDFVFAPPLTYFLQVSIKNENGKVMAYPRSGGGSGDFTNLKDVDGFIELPAGESVFHQGQVFSFTPFR